MVALRSRSSGRNNWWVWSWKNGNTLLEKIFDILWFCRYYFTFIFSDETGERDRNIEFSKFKDLREKRLVIYTDEKIDGDKGHTKECDPKIIDIMHVLLYPKS